MIQIVFTHERESNKKEVKLKVRKSAGKGGTLCSSWAVREKLGKKRRIEEKVLKAKTPINSFRVRKGV